MDEGSALEMRQTGINLFQGFESLLLRQSKRKNAPSSLECVFPFALASPAAGGEGMSEAVGRRNPVEKKEEARNATKSHPAMDCSRSRRDVGGRRPTKSLRHYLPSGSASPGTSTPGASIATGVVGEGNCGSS